MILKKIIKNLRKILSKNKEKFFNDDSFIVSYPKSGNTWVRFILSNLIYGSETEITFHTAKDFIPDFEVHFKELEQLERPRLLKSHSVYNKNFSKVIYVVRDVRDVYISYYHYLKKTLPEGKTISEFIREIDQSNNWSNHYESWINNKKNEEILLIRYEDLLSNTEHEVEKIIDFLNLQFSKEEIHEAVLKSSFENMSKIEDKYGRPFKSEEHKKNSTKFVRSGKKGEWKELLTKEDVDYINKRHQKVLNTLDYLSL